MTHQFAILLNEPQSPSADQLKSAFQPFSNLTDADAVRLALSARGILMRGMHSDAARALNMSLLAQGVAATVVAENALPVLPEGRTIHRLQLSETEFTPSDVLGNLFRVSWTEIRLVAAGCVQHFGMSATRTERTAVRFSIITGLRTQKISDVRHRVDTDSRLELEVLTTANTRFQLDASEFHFAHLVVDPALTAAEKFAWLVRQICARAPQAAFNEGATAIRDDLPVPVYGNRQALTDEMVWLIWKNATLQSGT